MDSKTIKEKHDFVNRRLNKMTKTDKEKREIVNKRLKEIECDSYEKELKKDIDFLEDLLIYNVNSVFKENIKSRIEELKKIIK